MSDFKKIKDNISIYDVAVNQLGMTLRAVGDGEYRGVSIAPGSHTHDDGFSLDTKKNEWFDFTLGFGGSVLDLVAYLKFGSVDCIREAAKFLDGDTDNGYWNKYADKRKKFEADVEKWHEALMKNERTLEYLHGRRITDETIERFKLGLINEYIRINGELVQEWRLSCPYFDRNGKPFYMASRALSWAAHEDSMKYHKLKLKQDDFLKNGLYGLNTLRDSKHGNTLVIGEGLFDMLSFAQEKYPVLSSIGGPFKKDHIPEMMIEAAKYRRIFTVFDIDKNLSGQQFTCRMGMHFLRAGIAFRAIPSFGEGNKDVSDYYTAGGNLQELLDSAVNGYVFMTGFTFWENSPKKIEGSFYSLSKAEKDKALSEVKQFVYKLKSFLEPKEFTEVIEALALYYPEDSLKKYSEGPTAQELLEMDRDEFLEGKHIFFQGSVKGGSFWEYHEKGFWKRITDAAMQGKISQFFGHKKSVKSIRTLSDMVRLYDTREVLPKFNSKRLWLFQNGVLDLDTGELREAKPEDYLTWQVSYRYDSTAKCPKFDKFLEEITCGNTSRLELIDDMLGYLLYEDNRLEKMFVLIGEGQNGKGTLLATIDALTHSVNALEDLQSVSNIPLKDFNNPVQLYQLRGSKVNFSYELNQNLKEDCVSALKSVISGEPVNGNEKFHDSVSIIPRCKLINATNHMPKVYDDTFGMKRRLAFMKFEACFANNPNTHLKEELQEELSGIFNRMYKAYKALLEREKMYGTNAIRLCSDQHDFMTEFSQTANPVAAFWNEYGDELVERKEVPTKEVFDMYRNFCERNSRFAGTENNFGKALTRAVKNADIELKKTRHVIDGKQTYCYAFIGSSTEPTEPTLEQIIAEGVIELDE